MIYTIRCANGEKQVEGEPYKIPKIKGYEFFVHDCESEGLSYHIAVSEKETGMQVTSAKNKTKLGQRVRELVATHGQEGFDKIIAKGREQVKHFFSDPLVKAINEAGVTLTESEIQALKRALIKNKIIKK